MSPSYVLHPPGTGPNYDWENDHTFVKVSSRDSGGGYTLMEDNLKAHFYLGLHRHRTHAETFYILDGSVTFYVDGDWHVAGPGTTLHIPPGVPHGVRQGQEPARMLMIFQPAGFDLFLEELATMTPEDFADTARVDALNAKYDIEPLGDLPSYPEAQT